MNTDKPHILYVDDEEFNLAAFKATFRPYYTIHTALSAEEGRVALKTHPISVIITDQRMPGITGVEFLESIIAEHPDPIRMVLTGYADIEAIIASINKSQVYRYITKPWVENDLKMTIDSALDVSRLKAENVELLAHLARYNKELEERVEERTEQLRFKSEELETSNRNISQQNLLIRQLDKEKSQFIELAGRDLKRPVEAIHATAQKCKDKLGKLSADDLREHLEGIDTNAQKLRDIVENLLLINELEMRGVQLYPTTLDPAMIAQTVVMTHAPHARTKSIEILYERGPGGMTHNDPTALTQIADHLISNAVKFSPANSTIQVRTACIEQAIHLTVSDQGPGFTEDDRAQLFRTFSTLSAKPTASELTTGLGLSIVKKYVDALHGTITLDSPVGKGASWTVVLPDLKR